MAKNDLKISLYEREGKERGILPFSSMSKSVLQKMQAIPFIEDPMEVFY